MADKHTPTPWWVHPDGEICSERTNHNNLNPVAVHADACNDADRALIVRAVNSFKAMREVLEGYIARCERCKGIGIEPWGATTRKCVRCSKARAARVLGD